MLRLLLRTLLAQLLLFFLKLVEQHGQCRNLVRLIVHLGSQLLHVYLSLFLIVDILLVEFLELLLEIQNAIVAVQLRGFHFGFANRAFLSVELGTV